MRSFLAELGLLIFAVVSIALALVPATRSSRRAILILAGVSAVAITLLQYYLIAYTGRGLVERAACVIFADGGYCARAPDAREQNALTDDDRIGRAGRREGEVFSDCELCPAMVMLPGGEFLMGSPVEQSDGFNGERPAHLVTIRPFAMGRYEVARFEWNACVRQRRCRDFGWSDDDRLPASGLNWENARDYIGWLNSHVGGGAYRMPTEAEWEYAARAGATTQYPWGASVHDGCAYGNILDSTNYSDEYAIHYAHCDDGYHHRLAPIGSYEANAFGLYDVIGNAWEWAEDCYVARYRGAPTDGSARVLPGCRAHVLRGGSYDTYARSARVSFRGRPTTEFNMGGAFGLRVARSIDGDRS